MGTVPVLNPHIALPKKQFQPPDFEKSIIGWKKTIYDHPARAAGENPVDFWTCKEADGRIASVRRELIAKSLNPRKAEEALSCANGDYYRVGDLQADHLVTAEKIFERLLEMVEAMNLDPVFAAQRMAHPESQNYFFKDSDGQYHGTKYLYQIYFNAIDNLWLLSTSANTTATGKGTQGPEWLDTHPMFGQRFLDEVGPLDNSTIIPLTSRGEMLAKVAREWFVKTYCASIEAGSHIKKEVAEPIRTLTDRLSGKQHPYDAGTKRASLAALTALAGAETIAKAAQTRFDTQPPPPRRRRDSEDSMDSHDSVSSGGSVNSSDVEVKPQTVALMQEVASRNASVQLAAHELLARLQSSYLKEAKSQRQAKFDLSDNALDTDNQPPRAATAAVQMLRALREKSDSSRQKHDREEGGEHKVKRHASTPTPTPTPHF